MTAYAGEELKVISTIQDFDGTAITDQNIASVTISIFDAEQEPVVDEASMIYDDPWYYMWDTDGLNPGTYKARVTAWGLTGGVSIEWKRVRLTRQPIVTT